jgi:hypothetical protein
MSLRTSIGVVVAVGILLAANPCGSLGADQTRIEWLRGTGKDLQMRLQGEVFERDGQPATDIRVSGRLNAANSNPELEAKVDGHRFEIWIPVNQVPLYWMWLKAASADGKRIAYQEFNAFELRQAAIDGIKLTLRSPTRQVQVTVVEKGRPVADAFVKADVGYGIDLRSRIDTSGIARFHLLPEQKLAGLMAWTEDYRIGGFSLYRTPVRDPNANEHVVELSRCRDQKLRFIDEFDKSVPGVDFVIQIATAPPHYNYIGTNEHSRMTTDARGEVIYKWFPDWKEHHFYAELQSDKWTLEGDQRMIDDAVVFKLKKRKIAERKRVTGRISSRSSTSGGFFVRLDSFQGERENYPDDLRAFTDADGVFSIDVLPDATYCAFVLDPRWVSETIDLIPFDSTSERITRPELSVSEGQVVEVTVTSEAQKRPYPNLSINFRREHHFQWQEKGETRHGTGGPGWSATTDHSGRVVTRTLSGKLKASVYTPQWRTQQEVEVRSGEPVKIHLHREVDEKQMVTGRVVLADGLEAELKGAEIRIGSIDGHYSDQQTLTSRDDGSFAFETLSAEIGVFGSTQDGRAAGSMIVKDLQSPVALKLRRTMEFHGQLRGEAERPLVGHPVWAVVQVEGGMDDGSQFSQSFEAKRIETKTDEQGNYTLRGLPLETKISLRAKSVEDSTQTAYLDDVYLEPNESRPRAVSHLAKTPSASVRKPLAARYKSTLRDCGLSGFHLMLIVADDADEVTEFVEENFMDYETNDDIPRFMQIAITGEQNVLDDGDKAFLNERKWPLPSQDRIFACAVDAKGNELGRLEIKASDTGAAEAAAAFIHRHAPSQADAEKKWNEAFAEAKRTNRCVWVRISQRYCGPCFLLSRWIDDQGELLGKDYVMLKIDDVLDQNGRRIAQRLTQGENHGVPFHAIFDSDGAMLIDSAGPLGNIGAVGGFEGKKHLRKMLLQSRQNLTDEEIDQIVESVGE